MKIEDVSKSIEVVNDEKLYIIDVEQWNVIKYNPVIDEVSLGGENIMRLLSGMIEFTKQHDEFCLAFYRCNIGTTRWRWLFCELLKTDMGWQRVKIEQIICENCGWKGEIANPTLPSLYDTVSNKQEALNFAWAQPAKNCPICGKRLPRFSIWTQSTLL